MQMFSHSNTLKIIQQSIPTNPNPIHSLDEINQLKQSMRKIKRRKRYLR
jgi:hypothetical protein